MDDQDNVTDTLAPYDHLKSKTKLLQSLAELLPEGTTNRIKVLEARATLEEIAEGTTVLHRYEPKVPRASWLRRLLNWIRRV